MSRNTQHEQDSITTEHKHRKHSSVTCVIVRMAHSEATDLASIIGQVPAFFANFVEFI